MRNNAAYLPESPIVYIIIPKSIRNRASFRIFALNKLRFATGKPAGLAFVANIPKLKIMTIKTKLQTLIAAMMATSATR